MNDDTVEYKGYTIVAAPAVDASGRWFGAYRISKDGQTIRTREHIFPGFLYFDAALNDTIEHAKLEIDYLSAGSSAAPVSGASDQAQ
jgi:hypothetical protein